MLCPEDIHTCFSCDVWTHVQRYVPFFRFWSILTISSLRYSPLKWRLKWVWRHNKWPKSQYYHLEASFSTLVHTCGVEFFSWSDDRTMCCCLVSLPCTGGRNKLALVCFCFCSSDHSLRLHPAQRLVLPQQLQPARSARRLRGAHLHLPLVSDVIAAATGAAALE